MNELFKNDREFSDEVVKQQNMVVAQHNDLITKAKYDLTTNEIKVMDFIISKIRPDDDDFKLVHSSLYELTEVLGLKRSGRTYNQLTQTLRNLRQKEVVIYNDETETATVTGWLTQFDVTKSGQIEAEISAKLAPYLLELKSTGNYTQHVLKDTIQLDSKYSIRLYKVMREVDKSKGKQTPIFKGTPSDLKERLNAPKSYNWSQLRQNVIDKAINEINLRIIDMELELKTEKKGRQVVLIEITNNFYPIEQSNHNPVPMINFLEEIK